jgi:hypothetical protein
MAIKTSNVPELVGSDTGKVVQFVASHDARELIMRLRKQERLTDDEILALAIIVGEAALAKYVGRSLTERSFENLLQVAVGRLLGELRQGLGDLMFRVVDVLEFMEHQVFHRLYVLRKKPHFASVR